MSHVTGPTSSMPGSRHECPVGTVCDQHSDRQAVARIQGETDSFGAEYIDMCQECYEANQNHSHSMEGQCDWCKTESNSLQPFRDADEGMCGPVYDVCKHCRTKHIEIYCHDELERLEQCRQ